MTRTGKIARLPHDIRQQLNSRILDNEPGAQLLAWLNALPEVLEILNRDFAGRPINDQNLSDWKQGGFVEWRTHAEASCRAITLTENSAEIAKTIGPSPAELLSNVVAIQLATLLADIQASARDPDAKLHALTRITRNLAALRRGDQSATRIQLAQARLAISGPRAEEHIVHKFREWMTRSNGWQYVASRSLTEEQRISRMTELLFGKPLSADDITRFIKSGTDSENPETNPPNPSL